MAVPSYDKIMYPMLKLAEDGEVKILNAMITPLADYMKLTDEERNERNPNQLRTTIFAYRAAWAKTYLKNAVLIDYPARGSYRITDRGRQVLAEGVNSLDREYLMRFQEFVDFVTPANGSNNNTPQTLPDNMAPEDMIQNGSAALNNALVTELLEKIKSCTPSDFERLVIKVLLDLGYGFNAQSGHVTGQTGDGGIDGIIREDILGLDEIYIQAKKWEGNVSRPAIQAFVGALDGIRAKKGVFITTSDFTNEAKAYAEHTSSKVILINGRKLAELMIQHNLGVDIKETYTVKRIDAEYFDE